jgi:Cytokine-induced anti-apoptosis inhibitor 1, Fe-S biogenesis
MTHKSEKKTAETPIYDIIYISSCITRSLFRSLLKACKYIVGLFIERLEMNKLSVRLENRDVNDTVNGEVIFSTSLKSAFELLQQNPLKPFDELGIWLDSNDLHTSGCDVWSNPMDLASFPLHNASIVTVNVIYNHDSTDIVTKNEDFQVIHTSFLLAGLHCTSEQKVDSVDGSWNRIFTAKKVCTISQPTSVKAVAIPKKAVLSNDLEPSTKVMISLDDDDNGLIDEDDLLQLEGDLAPPTVDMKENWNTSTNDCSGRKACDDCTCGRREAEEEQQLSKTPIKTSACGKCGLGDAFRCASCPYLGKPAFKPGEEHLVLDLQDDF